MGFLDKLFGAEKAKPLNRDLKEEALRTIDALNAQIVMIEDDPNLSEMEKDEKIRLLKREIRTFAESMGWKYDE